MLSTTYTQGQKRFSEESNVHYRYSSAEDLLKNQEVITEMIRHHQNHQRPRLKTLLSYFKGDNEGILVDKRRREEHLADNRATHNFAKMISQFIQGFLVGVPLKTTYPDETVDGKIRDININNEADEHNSDLVLDQSIYGRAYELVYRNKQDEVKFTALSPLETFVIYDETVDQNPIAAVRYITKQFVDKTTVFIYTEKEEYTYVMDNGYKLTFKDKKRHYFNGIRINEYSNNKFRQGDFEDVLSLIDLYDSAQSDTANYMTDFNDAMLKIIGNLDIDVEEAKEMKEHNILMLKTEPNGNGVESKAEADYIYKQYDVSGTEAYKDRLFSNILLFSSIPNLLDDKKSSAPQSGEALKMKLFALQQKRATKERLFKKALRNRYRLINNILSIASEGGFNVNDITITFTENLPPMLENELKWFTDAGGKLSQVTLLSQLSFIENPDEELERIKEEESKEPLKQPIYDFQQIQQSQNQEVVEDDE